jgi:hypothetical protein
MSTEEDCSDDTRDKLKDQLLYLMQGYPYRLCTLHNTIYLSRKSTVKSVQLILARERLKAHICPSLGPICNCAGQGPRGGGEGVGNGIPLLGSVCKEWGGVWHTANLCLWGERVIMIGPFLRAKGLKGTVSREFWLQFFFHVSYSPLSLIIAFLSFLIY